MGDAVCPRCYYVGHIVQQTPTGVIYLCNAPTCDEMWEVKWKP